MSGDYIITFPLTLDMGIGDYFSVYSIKGRCMVNETLLDFGLEEGISDEPESLCEIGTGEFLAVVNIYTEMPIMSLVFIKPECHIIIMLRWKVRTGRSAEQSCRFSGEKIAQLISRRMRGMNSQS